VTDLAIKHMPRSDEVSVIDIYTGLPIPFRWVGMHFVRVDDAFEHGAAVSVAERPAPARRRHKLEPGQCEFCDREAGNEFHPPHDASSGCASGKRPHCTCDTCF
jgi:hypothetical protein